MPDEEMWASFFRPMHALAKLGVTTDINDVAEFGCGYGTFTTATAQLVRGVVYAIDIDPRMVELTARKALAAGLQNVRPLVRDFVVDGTGLEPGNVDYAMLFNILHCEHPLTLLREAGRVLQSGGLLGVMHWNHDASTPRGPSMQIRPRPEQCQAWAIEAGFATKSASSTCLHITMGW
jgi:SAM-dependent methyltransferase